VKLTIQLQLVQSEEIVKLYLYCPLRLLRIMFRQSWETFAFVLPAICVCHSYVLQQSKTCLGITNAVILKVTGTHCLNDK
jgi:hypothetical protein